MAERIMVAGSGCILVAGVAVVDETIRQRLTGALTGEALSELSVLSSGLHRFVRMGSEALGYGNEGALLFYFAIAAIVLLVLMLRT